MQLASTPLKTDFRKIADALARVADSDKVHISRDGYKLKLFGEDGLEYIPSVTGEDFHKDKSLVKAIMGPYGSGKSVTADAEIIHHAISMPRCNDGVRRCRYAVIRNTYGDLAMTTIKTWMEWFGELGDSHLYATSPFRFIATFNDGEGSIELELIFLALDRPKDLRKLKSLELTGALIEEATELPHEVMRHLLGRINRYPKKIDLTEEYHSQLVMVTNAPDTDHWWYGLFEVQKPEAFKLFKQPPGLIKDDDGNWMVNPLADNINNLPDSYYLDMIEGASDDFIKVYACGEYGIVSTGKPVYNEYNDTLHSSDALKYIPALPINLCWDFGLTPCCAAFQLAPNGYVNVIAEFTSTDSGLKQFIKNVVKPQMNELFYSYTYGYGVGDPAGVTRAQSDEKTCYQILAEEGFPANGAYSNSPIARIGSVKEMLSNLIDGRPQLMISRACSVLRKGFIGSYQLERVPGEQRETYKDSPKKNFYSHIHDALQYCAMTVLRESKTAPEVNIPLRRIC